MTFWNINPMQMSFAISHGRSAPVIKLGRKLGNDQRYPGNMLTKAELMQQLKELGIEHHAKMTLLELDALVKRHVTTVKKEEIDEDSFGKLKTDPMANLQVLHRESCGTSDSRWRFHWGHR